MKGLIEHEDKAFEAKNCQELENCNMVNSQHTDLCQMSTLCTNSNQVCCKVQCFSSPGLWTRVHHKREYAHYCLHFVLLSEIKQWKQAE